MKIKLNDNYEIDLPTLIDTRLLVQANSGGGKSWALRRLLEQSHGKVQQIILDLEGEFSTLREKYDYILAGKDGDIPVDTKSASLLARKLLEVNVSAIIDLYELSHLERKEFVRRFISGMVNAPKNLWHPCLVVIDEAHVFCPEKGQSVAAESVIDLATRGRKRGFCAILATQRLSKLHKDAAAECNNKLIGRTGLDIDMKRAAEELGFSSKEQYLSLRNLEAGEFFVYGPAISKEVTKIKIGDVETTHPKAGSRIMVNTTPPTDKIKSILSKLNDLPQVAKQEEDTMENMKQEIIQLKRELIRAQKDGGKKVDQEMLQRTIRDVREKMRENFEQEWKVRVGGFLTLLQQISMLAKQAIDAIPDSEQYTRFIAPIEIPKVEIPKEYQIPVEYHPGTSITQSQDDKPIVGGALRMLQALAQRYPMTFTRSQLATLSKMSPRSGSYSTYLSLLKSKNLIEVNNGIVSLKEEAFTRSDVQLKKTPQTPEETREMWRENLVGGAKKIFDFLIQEYPSAHTKEEIGLATEYSYRSGSFSTYLSMLRSNGLIETQGAWIKAADILFKEI